MADKRKKTFTISELAEEFEITPRAIRFYESKGMLTPTRKGVHRIFSRKDRTNLRLILRGKRLGLSLAECEEIIALYENDSFDEATQIELLLSKMADRRADLHSKLKDIQVTLEELDRVEQMARSRLEELRAAE